MTRFFFAAFAIAGASLACCAMLADHHDAGPIKLVAHASTR